MTDDLRKISSELDADEVTWQIGAYSPQSTWSRKTVFTKSSSLDELIEIAPKGRIYSFELSARSGDRLFSLEVPGPKRRFVSLKYEGPGDELPESYWNVAELLKGAEKRGQKRDYAGAAAGPAIALSVPLLILDKVARLGWLYTETRPVLEDRIGLAFLGAVFSFFVLGSFAAGFYVLGNLQRRDAAADYRYGIINQAPPWRSCQFRTVDMDRT
ncbi:hypothetical protein L3i22_022580 [Actinoplanes sp. L3-i22]|nr:hypothetical protein L3i22_022580 [Actinoplanes sp. L3-i22]